MTVKELIEALKKLPSDQQNMPVYYLGGEFNGDYRKITKLKSFRSWGQEGICVDG